MVSGFLKARGSVFLLFAVLALAILPGGGRVALADAGQAATAGEARPILTRLLPAGFQAGWLAGTADGLETGEVRLALPGEAGTVIFRIREAAGGLSPARRAEIVAGRLQVLLDQGLTAGEITVTRRHEEWVVAARGQVLATADARTARLNNSQPQALAFQWAQNLVGALTQRDRPARSGRTVGLVRDPVAPDTLYAITVEGVQQSSDGGRTWRILPIPYTEGRPETPTPFPQSLAVFPGDPRRLLVGIYPGEIWHSEDGGATWEKTWTDDPASGGNARVYALEADPNVPGRAWAGLANDDRGYVLRSDDGGRTWERVWQGGGVIDLMLVEGYSGAVLIQVMEANPESDNGWEPLVYRSGDGGLTWERLGFGGILIRDSSAPGVVRSAPGVVYRTEWQLEKFGDRYLATGYRLKKSTDGGATWDDVAWSGVPSNEPWLFIPVTVDGQPHLLLQGDRTYYYRRWTLAPLPGGFAERRRQLEALVTEAMSWGLDDGVSFTYAPEQNALYVSGSNSGLYRLELGSPVVPWTPEEIVQKYLAVEPWQARPYVAARTLVPVPVSGPGLRARELVWTGRYEVLRREDLADGSLALTVRQYMRPRHPAPGQKGQVVEVVRYTFAREGISYGLYAVEPGGG
ncbi:MAG: exo-alpha-sialidase [Clostridia bacterium]|nr:MAG: exo-alpha-sialidase [Clostridia bacterium]